MRKEQAQHEQNELDVIIERLSNSSVLMTDPVHFTSESKLVSSSITSDFIESKKQFPVPLLDLSFLNRHNHSMPRSKNYNSRLHSD